MRPRPGAKEDGTVPRTTCKLSHGTTHANTTDRFARCLAGRPRLQQFRRTDKREPEHRSGAGGPRRRHLNFFEEPPDVYGGTRSEEILGAALGQDRAGVIVATKFGMALSPEHTGAAPKYVKSALEDSLRRLGTDYVDLYQLHRPDPATPIADTLATLGELVKAARCARSGARTFLQLS